MRTLGAINRRPQEFLIDSPCYGVMMSFLFMESPMRKAFVFACALLISGCASPNQQSAYQDGPYTPYKLTHAEKDVVMRGVRGGMKDPVSAIFGEMAAGKSPKGVITVCGYVNGRNSFGGYVGMQRFMGVLVMSPDVFMLSAIAHDDASEYGVSKVCSQSGAAIP